MKEDTKIEESLGEEQLDDVAGGGLLSGLFTKAPSVASQMAYHQGQATALSTHAPTLAKKNPIFSQRMNDKAASHLESINNLLPKY